MNGIKYSITKNTNWNRMEWEIIYYESLIYMPFVDETDIGEMQYFLHILEEKINDGIFIHTKETT